MERYENIVKIEEIRKLTDGGQYQKAVKILDTMEIHKIKTLTDLSILADVLTENGRFDEAMGLLERIYEKSKTRRILYQMVELAIKKGDSKQADIYLLKYMQAAPNDSYRFIFRYYIDKLKGEPLEVLVESLEQLKEYEYIEVWAYELAKLYHKSGLKDKCVRECSDIVLWFGDGIYVDKAKLLKAYYVGDLDPIHMLKAKDKNDARQRLGLDKTKDYSSIRDQINQYLDREDKGKNKGDNTKINEVEKFSEESDTHKAQGTIVEDINEYARRDTVEEREKQIEEKYEHQIEEREKQKLEEQEHQIEEEREKQKAEEQEYQIEEGREKQKSEEQEHQIEEEQEKQKALKEKDQVDDETEEMIDESTNHGADEGRSYTGYKIEKTETYMKEMETEMVQETIELPKAMAGTAYGQKDSPSKEVLLPDENSANTKIEGLLVGENNIRAEEVCEDTVFSLLSKMKFDYKNEFGGFLQVDRVREGLRYCLENILSDSSINQFIIVTGEKETGKSTLAFKVCKALYSVEWLKTDKIAKIAGENLNRINILAQKEKLYGASLIIENLTVINSESAEKLYTFIKEMGNNTFIVLEGSKEEVEYFLKTYPFYAKYFHHEISLGTYSLKQLIGFANSYMENKEYKFKEDALEEFIKVVEKIIKAEEKGTYKKVMELASTVRKAADTRYKNLLGDIIGSGNITQEDLLYIIKEDITTEVM